MQTTSSKAVLAALVGLLAAAACTTSSERSDLVAIKVVAPTLSTAAGSSTACELNAGTPELASGGFDPAVAKTYRLGLVVENRLVSNAVAAVGRLNTNDFQVEQARVDYEFPDPAYHANIAEHVVPANGLIKVGTSSPADVQLAPADVVTALNAALAGGQTGTVRFKVRLEGRLLDGSGVKSSQYEYTAKVCSLAAPNNCGSLKPACSAPKTDFECALGQDGDVTCQ